MARRAATGAIVRLGKLPWRLLLVAGSVAAVALLFKPLFLVVAGGTFAFFLLPVVLAGLLLGMRGGIVTALFQYPLTWYFSLWLGNSSSQAAISSLVSTFPMVLLGMGVGRFRDLSLAIQARNEELQREIAERQRLEEERRRLDERLLETQKADALGRLAGGIAHDFNNLLTGVLGNASLLAAALPAGSEELTAALEIEVAARRAADLARQMLAYSGRGHFVIERVDLSAIAREAATLARASVSKKVNLELELADSLPAVEADVTQLHQVALNLLINAAEALAEESGAVRVRTFAGRLSPEELDRFPLTPDVAPGEFVLLEVEDDGCGMDEETQRRIFDPFFSTKFAGRGLGLAAVLGIVRGHKGLIRVESAPGVGTRMVVALPALASTDRPAPAPARPTPAPDSGAPGERRAQTILVVDDEPTIRRLAQRALSREGYVVLVAANGREALALFGERRGTIDLVILDLTMPEMNGDEAAQALRALDGEVPILISSGYSAEEVDRRFEGVGVIGFLQKPFEAEVMLRSVRAALAH